MQQDVLRTDAQDDFRPYGRSLRAGGPEADGSAAVAQGNFQVRQLPVVAEQLAFHEVGHADKIRHERVRGFGVDAFGIADLLDHALVHHHDPVAHHERFGLIVRDVDRGDAHVVL